MVCAKNDVAEFKKEMSISVISIKKKENKRENCEKNRSWYGPVHL